MDVIYMIHSGVWYYGLSAFIVPLSQEFGWSRMEISLGISLSKVDSSIDGPITGWMSDHLGPRWTTIFSLVLSAILLLSLSFVNSLWFFYAVMFAIFVLPSSPMTAMATAVARWFDRKIGIAMGLYSAGGGLTGLVTPVLVWIIINYGWRMAFIVSAGILLGVCIPFTFAIRNQGPEHYGLLPDGRSPVDTNEQDRVAPDPANNPETEAVVKDFTLREALKDKSYWLLTIAFALSNFACQAVVLHLIPHLINIGFSAELAALGMSVVTLTSAAGRLGLSWLGDFVKKRYVYALCFASMLLGCLVFSAVSAPLIVFLALAIFGPGMGGQFSLRNIVQREYYGREHWGMTQGFTMLMSSIPTFLGPVYAGWIFDNYGSYTPSFISLPLIWATAMALVLMARPPKR